MTSSFSTHMLVPVVLALCLTGPASGAVVSADMNGGYGAQVMDIILQNWKQPPHATGSTSVIVRITNEGRPFSCELRKSSGNSTVDDAICMAVAKAGLFPPAPYAAPAEVALTFLYGPANEMTATAKAETPVPAKSYAETLMENAQPHIVLPDGLKGEFNLTILLSVQPDGSLAGYKMEKSSGSGALDASVLRALLQPGVITLPPDNKAQDVSLSFSVSAK